jgi:parvulin-like peptidyl-prolyl isomerase
MSETITITSEDIINQLKLSCQLSKVVEKIVARKIISVFSEEVGINVDDKALQIMADHLRFTNNLLSVDDTLAWLKAHYLSLDDFEQIAYNSIISTKLANHLFASKVESYFFENQLDYVAVAMYETVLDDEDLAIELFYSIKEGEKSFYDVAYKYIQDTELRRKGGYRGIVCRKDLKPEISAAVFAAKAPQLLKPIVTSKGVHLILVEEIIQPKLDDELRQKINSDLFFEWINQNIPNWNVIVKGEKFE